MSLKKLKFAKTTIPTPMGDIVLRGLHLPDVRTLIARHPDETQALYVRVAELAEQIKDKTPEQLLTMDMSEVDLVGVLSATIHAAPVMVAHMIALASDEDDDEAIEIAKTLPIDVQLVCLETIAANTFVMEGGARNFIASVVRIAKSALGAMKT